jgi:hypothetical protein
MNPQRVRTGVLAIAFIALAACNADVTPPADGSYFRATIEGAVSTEFEGAGQFSISEGGFFLFSAGRGSSAHQTFQIHNRTGELPAAGTYTLAQGDGDLWATFLVSDNRGGTLEGYAAYEGVVEITELSESGVEGTFRMSGFRMIHRMAGGRVERTITRTPDAPTIEVSGTFSARPVRTAPTAWRM